MFKLHALGGLSLSQDGQSSERSGIQRRQLALLAALAAAGAPGLSRDRLIGLMWPERANDRARNLLDQALYAARRVCGQSVFVASHTALALNPEVITSDVAEFMAAASRNDAAGAAAAYTGPFLDGLLLSDAAEFERWASAERARLAREYQRCVATLARQREERGEWGDAIRWWRRAVDADPFSGRAALGLMEALARAGDRAGALEFARVHEALVRQELGADVDPPLAALAATLRSGGVLPPAHSRARSVAADPATTGQSAASPTPRPPGAPAPPDAGNATRATTADTVREVVAPEREEPPRGDRDGGVPNGATSVGGTGPGGAGKGGRRLLRWIGLVILALVLLGSAGAALTWWHHHGDGRDPHAAPATIPPPSIVVLPFRNLNRTSADEYFSDGMTEELIAELSRLQEVRVVARTSSFAFKGRPMDVREIGRALSVTHILEGTVRRISDGGGEEGRNSRLRVSAELVDAETGYHVWSQQFDRPAGDIIAIQDEIASSIMHSLQREFAGPLLHGGQSAPAPAAYDAYLRARYAWHQRTVEGLRLARDLFKQVIANEPGYAPAYAGVGATYVVLPLYDHQASTEEMYALADSAATHALMLDSTLSEPYAVLGLIRARRYQWRAAERAYRQALARNANNATAHQWYGKALAHQGRLLEAEAAMRRALDLDPLSAVTRYNLGQVLFAQRRFDEAAAELQGALRTAPTFRAAHATLGYVRMSQRRREDAVHEFELAAGPEAGRESSDIAVLAYGYALAGQRDAAARLLAAALRGREANAMAGAASATSAADIAIAYMALGNLDSTFVWLERARREHDSDLQAFVASPTLDPLRGDARYTALRARLNLR